MSIVQEGEHAVGSISAKVSQRIAAGLRKFQPVLAAAKARDVNESDTVVIVTDLLHEVFGYEKYADITSEHMVRSTFCDLATKIDGRLALLIEVKAIGTDLKICTSSRRSTTRQIKVATGS